MIPAHPGYCAVFGSVDPNTGEIERFRLAVVAWDDDGCPMVVPEGMPGRPIKGLVRADDFESYTQVEADENDGAIIPGGGWMHTWTTNGEVCTAPVIAWQISSDGWGRPLVVDGEGGVSPDESPERRYWHPHCEPGWRPDDAGGRS